VKIAIVTNDLYSTWLFRRPLIKALRLRGEDVYVITPPDPERAGFAQRMDASTIAVPLHRFLSPLLDIKYAWRLYRVFRKERFDVVHTFTIKPNIFGPVAARIAGVRRVICSVTGLGYLFSIKTGFKIRAMRLAAKCLLRLSFDWSDAVSFQNGEDLELLVASHVVDRKKACVIRSSGVNLLEFAPGSADKEKMAALAKRIGVNDDALIVLMIVARVAWEKGVKEFIDAAGLVGKKCANALFLFVGPAKEDAPGAVGEEYLNSRVSDNFRWMGFTEDVREMIEMSSIVVLPSYYREGVPRILLEAMAMEKPVVTTDSVGCREAVDNGKTGYVVASRDSVELAEKIELLLRDTEMRAAFGKNGRIKARDEFDEEKVVADTLFRMYGVNV